jgi:cation diffusion facilitator CzcD-associated flavoprotein CzcO
VLYQPFPSNWPVYTPRDKLADWLEAYAISQDLLVWTGTTILPTPVYDEASRKWTVVVNRHGKQTTLQPAHIVLCTGTFGAPNVPSFPGMDSFKGQLLHSSAYRGGQSFTGRHVVVIGCGNSSADICQDLAYNGAKSVTMVQRGSTCVQKASTIRAVLEREFPLSQMAEVSDFKYASMSLPLIRKILVAHKEHLAQTEADMHEALRKGGFNVNMGDDGSGVFPQASKFLTSPSPSDPEP